MADTRTLAPRPESSTVTAALVLGDVALITLFVVLGEIQHRSLAAVPIYTPEALAPFLVGWVVTSLLAGVYAPGVRGNVRSVAARTALAWVGAALIGQAIRATPFVRGNAALAFVVVSLLVGLALLVPWRVLAAWRIGERG
jgi:hypothetical protein